MTVALATSSFTHDCEICHRITYVTTGEKRNCDLRSASHAGTSIRFFLVENSICFWYEVEVSFFKEQSKGTH